MFDLNDLIEKKVIILSTDGRFFEGILQGFDNVINLIISDCIERLIQTNKEEKNIELNLGMYLLRGNCVVCLGEVDENKNDEFNWDNVRGMPLKDTYNRLNKVKDQ